MKNSNSHIPLLILAIAVTATVAALYAYMWHASAASVRQANLARDIVLAETGDQSQMKSLSALAVSTALMRARLTSFFIPADDIVSFITAAESVGPQSGGTVSLASIEADPLDGKPVGTMGSVRAHIDAHGSWSSVMRALALYERMPYEVSIDNVSLNGSVGAAGHSTWSLSFDIRAALMVQASSTSS